MRTITLAAALAAAILPSAAGPASAAGSPAPLRTALERVVDAGAPGAVGLAGDRTAAAGVANLRTRRALRPGDRLRIGSVTKTFTAVVALQLVAEGRLSLADTVTSRLPGALPYGDRVTLRELLSHTSGVPDDVPAALREVFFGDPLRVWTPGDQLALVRDRPPRFAPGTSWAYSNTDYVLVGLMIEQATGHRLEDELQRRIVEPLGLRHTSFPVRSPRLGGRGARGYSLPLGPDGAPRPGALRDVTRLSPSFAWAAGNGVSTVGDMARLFGALLGGRLLPEAVLDQALTTVPTGRPGRRQGLGLELREGPHGALVGHDGDIPGYSIVVRSSRDGRRQAIVATNVKFATPRVDDALDEALDTAVEVGLAPGR